MNHLHKDTFVFVFTTATQDDKIDAVRAAAASFALLLENEVPDGPDKTYLLRKLREVVMWANVAITRHPDGAPR